MTKNELIAQVQQEVKGLSSSLNDDDYDNAVSSAEMDTGWALPQTEDLKLKWLKERTKRHLFFFLLSESASKFRFKNIYLNNRFEHYIKLIEVMDAQFAKAQEEYAFEFANVDSFKQFGTKVDAGFSYNRTGIETTYDTTNKVLFEPEENA